MIKELDTVKIKSTSDVVTLGWFKAEEEVEVVGVIPIKGKIHDKLYLVENEAKVRVGVYEEDIEEVISC